MSTHRLVLVLSLAALTAFACGKKEEPSPAGTNAPQTAATTTTNRAALGDGAAKEIFDTRCAACHGTEGKGNGPGAAALNPKPRNYTDKAWQAAVTDEQIKKTILLGGAAVGKSPVMPASPDLDEKPEVVDGLVKIVRRFGS
jgi:cytochrome c553